MTNTKFKVILKIIFLKFSNANILFSKKTLIQRFYITNEALFTIKQVQIIDQINFFLVALDVNSDIFVVDKNTNIFLKKSPN